MSWELLFVGLLGVVVWTVMCVLLHRHLADIAGHLTHASQAQALRPADLDRFWDVLEEQLRNHAAATEGRLKDMQTAVVQVRQRQNELAEAVDWMAPWVKQWARAAAGDRT